MAVFVLGRSEITLFVCSCIAGDRIAIATAWYERIVQDLAVGPATEMA